MEQRLVQECLTNIHRHSGSEVATIEIARNGASVRLEVQDKGKGISPQRLTAVQSQASGVGLRGMRERVRQFEGDMNIESSEKGTRIAFTIPLGEATDMTRVGLDDQLQNAG
jgi:signal transduction histidine kinase